MSITRGVNTIQVSPFGDVDALKQYHGAFVQDTWHVNNKLTVDYGVCFPSSGETSRSRQASSPPMFKGTASRLIYTDEFRDGGAFLVATARPGAQCYGPT